MKKQNKGYKEKIQNDLVKKYSYLVEEVIQESFSLLPCEKEELIAYGLEGLAYAIVQQQDYTKENMESFIKECITKNIHKHYKELIGLAYNKYFNLQYKDELEAKRLEDDANTLYHYYETTLSDCYIFETSWKGIYESEEIERENLNWKDFQSNNLNIEESVILSSLKEEIKEEIDKYLSKKERHLLKLHFVLEYSYSEIAKIYGRSPSSIGNQIRDLLQLLYLRINQKKYKDYIYDFSRIHNSESLQSTCELSTLWKKSQ